MSANSLIGIVVAILAVIAAYWLGHAHGHASGQGEGYESGKKDGTKEGSMRGYAVGYDRGKRHRDEPSSSGGGSHRGLGVLGLILATIAVFLLAGRSQNDQPRKDRPASNARQPIESNSVPTANWPDAARDEEPITWPQS